MNEVVGEDAVDGFDKFAAVFLAKHALAHLGTLFGEMASGDARALAGRDREAFPVVVRGGPGFVEESTAAVGGGHEPKRAITDGEHGTHGEIELIFNPSSFVDQEQRDAGEAADSTFGTGEADDAAAVRKDDGMLVFAIAARGDAELAQERAHLADELRGLAEAGAEDEREAAGKEVGLMDSFRGGNGGLAPLAGAIEDSAPGVANEESGLLGVQAKVEALPCKEVDVEKPAGGVLGF